MVAVTNDVPMVKLLLLLFQQRVDMADAMVAAALDVVVVVVVVLERTTLLQGMALRPMVQMPPSPGATTNAFPWLLLLVLALRWLMWN